MGIIFLGYRLWLGYFEFFVGFFFGFGVEVE